MFNDKNIQFEALFAIGIIPFSQAPPALAGVNKAIKIVALASVLTSQWTTIIQSGLLMMNWNEFIVQELFVDENGTEWFQPLSGRQ